ncbi:MAG TPA: deoxynucleoside kinase [Bacteroidia bacterium]|nr:deoxynucleoside kinase [Bacteroidia bacterium]
MASKPVTLKKSTTKSTSKEPVKTPSSKTSTVKSAEKYSPTKKQLAPLHIAIAGNIGAGKTTLATLLAKTLKWEPHYEDVDDNPYLNDFYDDMQRWSFNLQIYFLNSRFEQITKIRQSGKTVIQDRTIYEDANIFAPNLHAMGLMTTRDFNNYQSLFSLMNKFVSPPDLMIYLRGSVPTLVNQIARRGRDYENSIRIDYLKRLNERYEAWISTYDQGKLLVIDIDDLNFADNPEDLGKIINKINAEINGLF